MSEAVDLEVERGLGWVFGFAADRIYSVGRATSTLSLAAFVTPIKQTAPFIGLLLYSLYSAW